MPVDEILMDAEERMEKALDVLKKNLTGIRTGRANPGLVDSLRVEAYGSPVPIKQVASIGAPEPTQIVIRPYDTSTIKDIEKAIVASELGLNPQNDGKIIRINIPPLSGDTRKKLASRIRDLTEECKVSLRNVRRDANKAIDGEEKAKTISEDEQATAKDDVDKLLKKYEGQTVDLSKAKEEEVMEE